MSIKSQNATDDKKKTNKVGSTMKQTKGKARKSKEWINKVFKPSAKSKCPPNLSDEQKQTLLLEHPSNCYDHYRSNREIVVGQVACPPGTKITIFEEGGKEITYPVYFFEVRRCFSYEEGHDMWTEVLMNYVPVILCLESDRGGRLFPYDYNDEFPEELVY